MASIADRKRRRLPTIPGLPECLLWDLPSSDLPANKGLIKDWQAGRCAACGITPYALVEDHDHDTGLTRGWLCRPCNSSEASSGALLWQWWRRGANPAEILRVRAYYVNGRGLTVIRGRRGFVPEDS